MKKRITAVIVWALCFVGAVSAQAPADSSKQGSEREKLALFAGKWAAEADFNPSDTGSGGKSKWTETCEWSDGKFALVCQTEGEFGGRPVKAISTMAYDGAEKTYIYFETNNRDEHDFWRGKVEGDTWTWSEKGMMEGKPTSMRFTQKWASADSMTFLFETATGDAPLKAVMNGKQVRQK